MNELSLVPSATDMRRSGRWVRWREGVAAAVIVACGLGMFRFVLPMPVAVTEAILLLAIFAVPLTSPALIAIMRGTSFAQRAVFGGIAAAALIGHFHGKIYDTFPFVRWDIYASAPAEDIRLFDYYAVRHDATEEHLVPADLFPALRKKLAIHLEQVARAIDPETDTTILNQARRMELTRRYDALLRAMARAYNREHADNPLVAIRIEQWSVPVHRYDGRPSIVRHPFRIWRINGEVE